MKFVYDPVGMIIVGVQSNIYCCQYIFYLTFRE